jgi:hypothetical protein
MFFVAVMKRLDCFEEPTRAVRQEFECRFCDDKCSMGAELRYEEASKHFFACSYEVNN